MSKRRWLFAALLAGLLGLFAAAALIGEEARSLDAGWPVDFAHRGASSRAPENTLESFRLAADSGTKGLELDVHMTVDGRIAVIHDDAVDRTTEGSGFVRAMTLRELQTLDAGYRFTPDGGRTHPYRGRGVRVPEFGEVLREFPDHRVNIDIKEAQPGVEEALLEVLDEADARDRVLVVSQAPGVLERFRELSGGSVLTGASRQEIEDFYRRSRLHAEVSLSPAYDALQVPVESAGTEVVTPRFIEAAHNRGVRVDVWTIDDPDEMRRLLNMGVDVIMTNRPEVLEEVLEERR